ncbi:hypothetical protein MSAN_01312600 [Mycena sanguinolenta]|uniref:Uncharacterized protein n=1 Tax=Mycena sanguinolenta TaxID=230812 RepID=A0A8H6YDV1_9AGAR|nr:hypothetical protein MSAN_01312600 [Mycena sanguinolenta]
MSSKTLTFYNSISNATKRLRTPVQIVLTLSLDKPAKYRNSKEPHDERTAEPQLPIAWQVLQFDLPNAPRNVSVDYSEEFGVTEVVSEIKGVYQPGLSGLGVEAGKLVKYSGQAWSSDTLYNPGPPLKHFAIQNNAGNVAEIALCCYSPREQDESQPYIPVVFLGPLDDGCEFRCTTPVFLQAYLAVNHKRGQRLAQSVVEQNFLFKDSTGKPEPKVLANLKRNCAFQVYSLPNGEIMLEMTTNRD